MNREHFERVHAQRVEARRLAIIRTQRGARWPFWLALALCLLIGAGAAMAAAPAGYVELGTNEPRSNVIQCKPNTPIVFVRTADGTGHTTNNGTCPASGTRTCRLQDADSDYYTGMCWGEPVSAPPPPPPASAPVGDWAQANTWYAALFWLGMVGLFMHGYVAGSKGA